MSLRFMSLASGSSGNCYYLGCDSYGFLIDAGIGIRTIKKTLRDHHIPLESIRGLCITHDHADHIKAAGCLGEKYNIPVYSTATMLKGMNRSYCMTEKIAASSRLIEKDVPFQIGDFTITPFGVSHDGTDNVGYFVQYGETCFAFATDLGYIPTHVASYLSRAHYLIIESNYDEEMLQRSSYPAYLKQRISSNTGHMSNRDTAEFLATHFSLNLKYIFLCHLSKENNHPELAYKTIEMRFLQEGIRVGRTFQLIPLKRNTPSQFYSFE